MQNQWKIAKHKSVPANVTQMKNRASKKFVLGDLVECTSQSLNDANNDMHAKTIIFKIPEPHGKTASVNQ